MRILDNPLAQLFVSVLAIMAVIVVIKLAVSYLPSSSIFGAIKQVINIV